MVLGDTKSLEISIPRTMVLPSALSVSPRCFGRRLGGLGRATHGSRGLGGSCSLRLGCFRLLLCRSAGQQGSSLTRLVSLSRLLLLKVYSMLYATGTALPGLKRETQRECCCVLQA